MMQVKNALQVLIVVNCLSLLFGMLHPWFFLADLFCQFRLITVILTLLFGLILLPMKSWRWSALGVFVGSAFLLTLWPFLWPAQGQRPVVENMNKEDRRQDSRSYKLLSHNVLLDNSEMESVTEFIIEEDPDFILLLEVTPRWQRHLEDRLSSRWPVQKFAAREDAFGLCVLSKFPFQSSEVIQYDLQLPPIIRVEVSPEGVSKPFRLFAVHPVPPLNSRLWSFRNSLLNRVTQDIRSGNPARTIIGGDFNCAPWCDPVVKLQRENKLYLTSRYQGLQMSWMPTRRIPVGLPIDHVLIGEDFELLEYRTGGFRGSDHRPILIRFSL